MRHLAYISVEIMVRTLLSEEGIDDGPSKAAWTVLFRPEPVDAAEAAIRAFAAADGGPPPPPAGGLATLMAISCSSERVSKRLHTGVAESVEEQGWLAPMRGMILKLRYKGLWETCGKRLLTSRMCSLGGGEGRRNYAFTPARIGA